MRVLEDFPEQREPVNRALHALSRQLKATAPRAAAPQQEQLRELSREALSAMHQLAHSPGSGVARVLALQARVAKVAAELDPPRLRAPLDEGRSRLIAALSSVAASSQGTAASLDVQRAEQLVSSLGLLGGTVASAVSSDPHLAFGDLRGVDGPRLHADDAAAAMLRLSAAAWTVLRDLRHGIISPSQVGAQRGEALEPTRLLELARQRATAADFDLDRAYDGMRHDPVWRTAPLVLSDPERGLVEVSPQALRNGLTKHRSVASSLSPADATARVLELPFVQATLAEAAQAARADGRVGQALAAAQVHLLAALRDGRGLPANDTQVLPVLSVLLATDVSAALAGAPDLGAGVRAAVAQLRVALAAIPTSALEPRLRAEVAALLDEGLADRLVKQQGALNQRQLANMIGEAVVASVVALPLGAVAGGVAGAAGMSRTAITASYVGTEWLAFSTYAQSRDGHLHVERYAQDAAMFGLLYAGRFAGRTVTRLAPWSVPNNPIARQVVGSAAVLGFAGAVPATIELAAQASATGRAPSLADVGTALTHSFAVLGAVALSATALRRALPRLTLDHAQRAPLNRLLADWEVLDRRARQAGAELAELRGRPAAGDAAARASREAALVTELGELAREAELLRAPLEAALTAAAVGAGRVLTPDSSRRAGDAESAPARGSGSSAATPGRPNHVTEEVQLPSGAKLRWFSSGDAELDGKRYRAIVGWGNRRVLLEDPQTGKLFTLEPESANARLLPADEGTRFGDLTVLGGAPYDTYAGVAVRRVASGRPPEVALYDPALPPTKERLIPVESGGELLVARAVRGRLARVRALGAGNFEVSSELLVVGRRAYVLVGTTEAGGGRSVYSDLEGRLFARRGPASGELAPISEGARVHLPKADGGQGEIAAGPGGVYRYEQSAGAYRLTYDISGRIVRAVGTSERAEYVECPAPAGSARAAFLLHNAPDGSVVAHAVQYSVVGGHVVRVAGSRRLAFAQLDERGRLTLHEQAQVRTQEGRTLFVQDGQLYEKFGSVQGEPGTLVVGVPGAEPMIAQLVGGRLRGVRLATEEARERGALVEIAKDKPGAASLIVSGDKVYVQAHGPIDTPAQLAARVRSYFGELLARRAEPNSNVGDGPLAPFVAWMRGPGGVGGLEAIASAVARGDVAWLDKTFGAGSLAKLRSGLDAPTSAQDPFIYALPLGGKARRGEATEMLVLRREGGRLRPASTAEQQAFFDAAVGLPPPGLPATRPRAERLYLDAERRQLVAERGGERVTIDLVEGSLFDRARGPSPARVVELMREMPWQALRGLRELRLGELADSEYGSYSAIHGIAAITARPTGWSEAALRDVLWHEVAGHGIELAHGRVARLTLLARALDGAAGGRGRTLDDYGQSNAHESFAVGIEEALRMSQEQRARTPHFNRLLERMFTTDGRPTAFALGAAPEPLRSPTTSETPPISAQAAELLLFALAAYHGEGQAPLAREPLVPRLPGVALSPRTPRP